MNNTVFKLCFFFVLYCSKKFFTCLQVACSTHENYDDAHSLFSLNIILNSVRKHNTLLLKQIT